MQSVMVEDKEKERWAPRRTYQLYQRRTGLRKRGRALRDRKVRKVKKTAGGPWTTGDRVSKSVGAGSHQKDERRMLLKAGRSVWGSVRRKDKTRVAIVLNLGSVGALEWFPEELHRQSRLYRKKGRPAFNSGNEKYS